MTQATKTKAPPPGIYTGVSFEEYAAWNAVNFHALEAGRLSMRHMQHAMSGEDAEPTDAMLFGQALHIAVFEPHRYAESVIEYPRFEGKGSREARAQWEAEHAGRIFLTADELQQIADIQREILSIRLAKSIAYAPGAAEVCAVWSEAIDLGEQTVEVECKARIDKLYAGYFLADLKSTTCAEPEQFARKIVPVYGYHRQMAWYRRGATANGVSAPHAVIIAAEKSKPYGVSLIELTTAQLDAADAVNMSTLTQWAVAVDRGSFPGYCTGEAVHVELPAWA